MPKLDPFERDASGTARSGGHTPGPWTISEATGIGGKFRFYVIHGSDQVILASTVFDAHSPHTHLPNARLIAAAPDMLAALKACVVMYGEDPTDDWTAMTKTRAAIAKAEKSNTNP